VSDAEVGDPGPAVLADQDVLGLEVAVDQAGAVRGRQPFARLDERAQDLAAVARPLLEPLAQGLTADVLHGDEEPLTEGSRVVDRDDVRVRQPRHRLRLTQKARPRVLPDLLQELDRHLPVEVGVVGGVDGAHFAFAEQLDHDVAPDRLSAREPLVPRASADERLGKRVVEVSIGAWCVVHGVYSALRQIPGCRNPLSV
jgi:hypothetical protein